jgi:hypothetical protein
MSNRRPPAGGQPLGGSRPTPSPGGSSSAAQRPQDRYKTPTARRMALAPGLLGAIVMLAGLALLDNEGGFVIIRYGAAILAAIVGWFAIQGRAWWALPLLAAILVIWNPVFPFLWHGQLWVAGQFVAAIVFVLCALLVRVRAKREDARPS